MKLILEIDSPADVDAAVEAMKRFVTTVSGASFDAAPVDSKATTISLPAPKPRGTRAKPALDPVAAYNALATAAGVAPVDETNVQDVAEALAEVETVLGVTVPEIEDTLDVPPVAAPSVTATRDEMLATLRTHCASAGAIWMRKNIIDVYKVNRLSDLTDEGLAALYSEVVAA